MLKRLISQITKTEVKCLEQCTLFSEEQIASGKCPYTKYSRSKTKRLDYTKHDYADNLHYHYRCVLSSLGSRLRNKIIRAKDKTALKTHYPYYAGLESLLNG